MVVWEIKLQTEQAYVKIDLITGTKSLYFGHNRCNITNIWTMRSTVKRAGIAVAATLEADATNKVNITRE